MKKLLILILSLCTVISFASCNKEEKKPTEKLPDIRAWTMHGFEKTVAVSAPRGELSTEYKVYLAKGETEGCQVAVYSDTMYKNATFTMKSGETELIKPAMYSLERVHEVGKKEYTDSAIPYYGGRVQIYEKKVLAFMLEFTTDENTPAGEYGYVYELKDNEKNVIATYNVTVHVWDFALPEEKTFVTAAGLYWNMIEKTTGKCDEETYKLWYDTMLEHNICAFDLPYDELDPRADEYMSNPRVTSFKLPVPEKEDGTIDEEKLLEYYNKLKSNPVWLEKAYFYVIDEPRTPEHIEELETLAKKLNELCPEIELMVPYYTNLQISDGVDQTDVMAEYIDLWCPKLCLWDDERSYGDYLDYVPGKSYAERMKELQESGDRVWTYVCNDPDDPYAQMFIDTVGANQRYMFWQMYQRDIEGFAYWSVNYYGYKEGPGSDGVGTVQNPWLTVNTKIPNGEGKTIYGCGFLFYPGTYVGATGAVPSIRAKIVRDGCDDIELLYLAEQYLDPVWLSEKLAEGTPNLTTFASGDKLATIRIAIGNALEAAMKK